MARHMTPVQLTQNEYDFVWGLLAIQDPGAKILKYMVDQAVTNPDFIAGFNHTAALQKRLEMHHRLEKLSYNPFHGLDSFDLADPSDAAMLKSLEEDDAIPRLYRPVTPNDNSEQAQFYAMFLDETIAAMEENGVLITTDSARKNNHLLYAPIENKNLRKLVIKQGRAQREFFENSLDVALRPRRNAEDSYGLNLDIRPN